MLKFIFTLFALGTLVTVRAQSTGENINSSKKMINRENFKDFVTSNKVADNACDHSEYASWKNIAKDKLNNEFVLIGDLNDDRFAGNYTYIEQIDEKYEYWKEDARIAVNLYPAQSAIVYQCPKCHNVFLQYMENGGHGSQTRFRIVRPELIEDNLASFRFKLEVHEYQKFLDDLGLTKEEFVNRVKECKELPGVPTDMKLNEFYIKDYSGLKQEGFPKTYEIVTNKPFIMNLIDKYK